MTNRLLIPRRSALLLAALLASVPCPSMAQAPEGGPAPDAGASERAARALASERAADVTVWGRPIARLRASYGGLSPSERAAAAEERVERTLLADPAAPLRLQTVSVGAVSGVLVIAGSEILFGLVKGDLPAGGTLEGEGARAISRLRDLARAMERQRDAGAVAAGVARSLAGILLLAVVFWLLERRLRPWLLGRMAVRRPKEQRPSGPSPHAIIDRETLTTYAIRTTLRSLFLFVELIGTFLCAQFVLRSFPYTQALGDQLAGRMIDLGARAAASFAHALPDLFVIALIVVAARAAWNVVKRWTLGIEAGRFEGGWIDAETARPTRVLLGLGIWLVAIVGAYPFVPGSDSDGFKGVSVLVGLMVTLGGSSVIGQIIAGLVVLYSRAVRRGDFVTVGEHEGHVQEVGLLATRLSTAYSELVNIPSSVMVTAVSRNSWRLAAPGGAVMRTAVTIGYDAPWRLVQGLLLEAAERTPGVLREPPPRVHQRDLSTFAVEYVLFLQFDRTRSRVEMGNALHATILDLFNEHGVQIMTPAFESQPEGRILVPPEKWAPAGPLAASGAPDQKERPQPPQVTIAPGGS